MKTDGLPLDSARWNELAHAYGKPTSTVQLIRDLRGFINGAGGDYQELRSRTHDEFGNNLFHQQSRYTATIAAVPHFVSLADRLPIQFQFEILCDVGWIHWLGGNVLKADGVTSLIVDEDDLVDWYDRAIDKAARLSVKLLSYEWDKEFSLDMQLILLGTACGLNGFPHLAHHIHWWEERRPICPECNARLYARYLDHEYVMWDDRLGLMPERVAAGDRYSVTPYTDPVDYRHADDFAALLKYTSSPTMSRAEVWVRSLHGTFRCCRCDHAFRLPKDYGPPAF